MSRVQYRQNKLQTHSYFHIWGLSWADSNLSFPGLRFPFFQIWLQPHLPCHWSPNRRTFSPSRFLTEYPLPADLPYPLPTPILSMTCWCFSFSVKPLEVLPHTSSSFLYPHSICTFRVLGNHVCSTCILLLLSYWSSSYYQFNMLFLNFHVYLFFYTTCIISNYIFSLCFSNSKLNRAFDITDFFKSYILNNRLN